jgi:Ser-tRNA(Ala) deacylase AlaX
MNQTNVGPTRAVYQYQAELRTHLTKVLAVSPVAMLPESDRMLFKQALEGDLIVATEETIFHAQGGGQPSDVGVIIPQDTTGEEKSGRFEVCSVRYANNSRILHQGRFNPAGISIFESGFPVQQIIDGKKRDLNSRIHTAGHLLGLAVRQLADLIPNITEVKAQHYPNAAFVEFQGVIDEIHKSAIQNKVDDLVRQALAVNICWLSEQEARERCVNATNFDFKSGELTRAVDIAGLGAYPCGGTHVTDTSQIGAFVVRKMARQKGKTKISYDVQ